jgi:hypothetical protein
MSGELLTAYARIEFIYFVAYGVEERIPETRLTIVNPMFYHILDLLEEHYPLHYEKFVHYVNSFPRFPLYSMAARDYARRSKKITEFLKSIRTHLWRPGGELSKSLESSETPRRIAESHKKVHKSVEDTLDEIIKLQFDERSKAVQTSPCGSLESLESLESLD